MKSTKELSGMTGEEALETARYLAEITKDLYQNYMGNSSNLKQRILRDYQACQRLYDCMFKRINYDDYLIQIPSFSSLALLSASLKDIACFVSGGYSKASAKPSLTNSKLINFSST